VLTKPLAVSVRPEAALEERVTKRASRRTHLKTRVQKWQEDEAAQEELRAAIEALLGLVFVQGCEVPLAAMHHKEVLGELLATRQFEVPATVSVRATLRGLSALSSAHGASLDSFAACNVVSCLAQRQAAASMVCMTCLKPGKLTPAWTFFRRAGGGGGGVRRAEALHRVRRRPLRGPPHAALGRALGGLQRGVQILPARGGEGAAPRATRQARRRAPPLLLLLLIDSDDDEFT
jgi:hypothetical protein